MLKQRIIKPLVKITDVGLYLGHKVTLMLRPIIVDIGIIFTCVDLDLVAEIPAIASAIGDTRLASVLQENGIHVSTVKHLVSACVGLGIDNLCVDIDAEKIPIMDDSAASFVFLLQSAGIEEQDTAKRFIHVTKPMEVCKGDEFARPDPRFGFKSSFMIEFRHPAVDKIGQTFEIDLAGTSCTREITRTRTPGFVHEVGMLREAGPVCGGSLDNAIVLDEYRMLNNDELCYGDEFIRHKIPDAIDDLYVVGHPLITVYTAHKSDHNLNNALLHALLAGETAYETVTFDKVEEAPRTFLPQ